MQNVQLESQIDKVITQELQAKQLYELRNAQSASHVQSIYNNLQCTLFVLLSAIAFIFIFSLALQSQWAYASSMRFLDHTRTYHSR